MPHHINTKEGAPHGFSCCATESMRRALLKICCANPEGHFRGGSEAAIKYRTQSELLLYSYMNGIYSSRQIAAATHERIDLGVLTGDQHPFHTVVSEFRLRHLDALPGLSIQLLKLCDRAGLVKPEHVSLDGSKINAV